MVLRAGAACTTRKKDSLFRRRTLCVEAPDRGFAGRICNAGLVIAGLARVLVATP